MGDVTNVTATAAAKHNSAGVPANCAYFEANDATLATAADGPDGRPDGRPVPHQRHAPAPTTRTTPSRWPTGPRRSVLRRAGDVLPRLTGGNVVTSTVFTAAGNVVSSTWASARDAVSAAIMRQQRDERVDARDEHRLRHGLGRHLPDQVRLRRTVGTGAAVAPFNANFNNGLSCDVFTLTVWYREEQTPTTPIEILPSPRTARSSSRVATRSATKRTCSRSPTATCWARPTRTTSPATEPVGRTGWASHRLQQASSSSRRFPAPSTVSPTPPRRLHRGLPVVGFVIQDFANGNVGGVASNYGGSFVHKYFRSIGTTP